MRPLLVLTGLVILGMMSLPALAQPSLAPSQILRANESLHSPNGQYRLVMQADCNLVLYEGREAYWSTRTEGRGRNCRAVFQRDGNLVVYAGASRPVWDSVTWGSGGRSLILQDDGNLVIYAGQRAIWSTDTVRTPGHVDAGHPPLPQYSASLEGCARRGGVISRGPFGHAYCRIILVDGGQACTDTSQCIGACVYLRSGGGPLAAPAGPVTGACQRSNVQYGCFGRVVNGLVEHFICAD